MPAGDDEIYRSIKFNRDGVDFSQWPKLSCSAANELTLATKDDANPGFARLAIAGELKLQIGVAVNELSSDGKLTNNSDLVIPTQKAVKTYVDAQLTQVNQTLSTKAALAGDSSQDFQSKNLTVSGNFITTGNVGIGTTTPTHKFHVLAADAVGLLESTGSQAYLRLSTTEGLNNRVEITNRPGGRLSLFTAGAGDAFNITRAGNVGIGTTTPTHKFHVLAADAVGLLESTGSQAYLRLSTTEGLDNRVEITNRPGGRLSLFTAGAGDVFNITRAGNVGIGTTAPVYKLDIAGSAHASSFPTSSDIRLKKDVTQLTNVLEKLEKIRGVSFEWNELYESLGRSTGHKEIGVMAQEVEAIFPELVTTWGEEDYKAVDYGRLTGVLIEAAKELKAENDLLKQRIEALERAIKKQ